jgi:hypothetical protein
MWKILERAERSRHLRLRAGVDAERVIGATQPARYIHFEFQIVRGVRR